MSGNRLKQCLIFGDGIKSPDHVQSEDLDEIDNERDSITSEEKQKPSAYVQVFENMVRTILECESDLLSLEEVGILEHFKDLCYNARYCLVRLILRTSNRWYPTSSLESFKKEVGEDGLKIAIEDLCSPFIDSMAKENNVTTDAIDNIKLEPEDDPVIKQEDNSEIIDLCMDSDDEKYNLASSLSLHTDGVFNVPWPQSAGSGPQLPHSADPIHSLLASDISTISMESFCQNESIMTTREILDRVNRDQLVTLAKEMKCALRPNSKKVYIIDALERQAASQQVLDFGTPLTGAKGKSRADGLRQTQISFFKVANLSKPKKNQEQRLRELAVKRLGPCVRVNIEFHRLVRRLHIIYFRETEHPIDVLLPALLSTFKKRNFTPVTHKRTSKVWASRKELLQYERALELDKLLDEMEEERVPKRATKTPAPRIKRESFTTPVTPGSSRDFSTPLNFPSNNNLQSAQPKSDWNGEANIFENIEDVVETTREQRIKNHFDDWVYPEWQELVAVEDEGVRPRPIGLERFDAGHVYTRMVHKALKVVAKLKDYNLELRVLEALLEQRFWCRGKRAKWHTRRAIVLGHLVTKEKDLVKKRDLQLRILEGVKEALLDDDTGIVHRPNLVKRLQDLEKKLKIPLEERSQCSGELRQAPFINLKAIRVQPQSLDAQGRPINNKENTPELHKYILVTKMDTEDKPRNSKQTGKSSWQGRGGQVVNVETRALEYYQDQGYKGFHCETRILTMLFGLLFWDIIFAEVLGAFETPYQTAPLDLFYDSFYRARKERIDERCQEIRDGKAREILEKHDKAHRDKAIICVGVSWEVCSREDLLDIVDCIGGQTLSIICQIFCEDYEGRRSGGPDLFVWNVESPKCKFVEVKGPGDTPQENQKLWFDSLLRANANVEICYVKDSNTRGSSKKHRKNTSSSSARRKRTIAPEDDLESEEQDYDKKDCQYEVDADLDELPTLERPNKRPRTGNEQNSIFNSSVKLIQTPSRPKPRTS